MKKCLKVFAIFVTAFFINACTANSQGQGPVLDTPVELEGISFNIPSGWEEQSDETFTFEEWTLMTAPPDLLPVYEIAFSDPVPPIAVVGPDGQSHEAPITDRFPGTIQVVAYGNSRSSLTVRCYDFNLDGTVEDAVEDSRSSLARSLSGDPALRGLSFVLPSSIHCALVNELTVDGIACPIYHFSYYELDRRDNATHIELLNQYRAFLFGPDMHYVFIMNGDGGQLLIDLIGTASLEDTEQSVI